VFVNKKNIKIKRLAITAFSNMSVAAHLRLPLATFPVFGESLPLFVRALYKKKNSQDIN
jgi:hypothetical protein